jgi:hypothetical protein
VLRRKRCSAPGTCDKLNKVACSAHQNELDAVQQQQQAANQKSSTAPSWQKNYAFRARGGACKSRWRTRPTIFPRFFLQFIRRSSGGNQLAMCNRIKRGLCARARGRVNEFTPNENLNAATAARWRNVTPNSAVLIDSAAQRKRERWEKRVLPVSKEASKHKCPRLALPECPAGRITTRLTLPRPPSFSLSSLSADTQDREKS